MDYRERRPCTWSRNRKCRRKRGCPLRSTLSLGKRQKRKQTFLHRVFVAVDNARIDVAQEINVILRVEALQLLSRGFVWFLKHQNTLLRQT